MKYHPLSGIPNLLTGPEFEALVEDIRSHGLREPIVLLDGMVLDGRNRLRACVAAGVEPRTEVYKPEWGDPKAWVLSKLTGRQMSQPQKWVAAANSVRLVGITVAQAAAKFAVPESRVRTALKLAQQHPGLFAEVESGKVSYFDACASAFPRVRRVAEKTMGSESPIDFGGSIQLKQKLVADPVTGAEYLSIDTSDFEPPERLQGTGDAGIAESFIRLVIPDSHGAYIDPTAATIAIQAAAVLKPQQVVWLGDHVDAGGLYSAHQPNYVEDREYSYETDIAAAEAFIDAIMKHCSGDGVYLEGNHEGHVERWIARTVPHAKDAKAMARRESPDVRLRLKERGIRYIRSSERYDGLAVTGTVRLGKCYFTHGFTASKFATAQHVQRFGNNIVHGHTHRVQEHGTRTVSNDAIGGWCPGTLAMLQPLYMHTNPTEWRHGIGLQVVGKDGRFIHVNVPIIGAWSGLQALLGAMRPKEWIK